MMPGRNDLKRRTGDAPVFSFVFFKNEISSYSKRKAFLLFLLTNGEKKGIIEEEETGTDRTGGKSK